jgi:hypothetical protein
MREHLSRATRLGLVSLALVSLALAWAGIASAATPPAGTVGAAPNPPFQNWQGNTYAVSLGMDPALCPSQTGFPSDPVDALCDHYRLTAASTGSVQFRIDWDDPDADFDLRVYQCPSDPTASCDLFIDGSVSPATNFETVTIPVTAGVTYEARIQPAFVFLPADYRGCAAFTARASCTSTGGVVATSIDPPVSISNARVKEGDSGTTNAMFTVSLGWATVSPVTVNYVTKDGTATAGSDYVPTTGTVVIPAGQTSATFGVPVIGDYADEPDETFEVDLALGEPGILVAKIKDPQGFGKIVDDDWRRLVSGRGTVGALSSGNFTLWVAENRSGKLNYKDSTTRFYSTQITDASFTDATRSATIDGTGVCNGHSVTFTLQVSDGAIDTYVLTLNDGTRITGPLTSGDITYTG